MTNSFKLTLIDGSIFDCERQLRFEQVAWRRQVIQRKLDRLKARRAELTREVGSV